MTNSKIQIPNSKQALNPNFQERQLVSNRIGFWSLEFVWDLDFGIWILEPAS